MVEMTPLLEEMKRLSEDRSVPSNVREMLNRAIKSLKEEDKDLSVRVNTATSLLDEISNDPNIAQHTRTKIWNLASKLESLKEE